MDAVKTDELEEGKYVYSVIIEYPDGNLVEATSGLVFVKNAFGIIRNDEDTTPDPDPNPGPEPIDPPGSGGDDGGPGSDPGGTPFPYP